MTKPLGLVYYSNLLPGTQIANRLHELGYRVQTVDANGLVQLAQIAEKEKPLLLVAEMEPASAVSLAVAALKACPATAHIPVLAYAGSPDKNLQESAKKSGASLLAKSQGILDQLPQLLDQVLQVE